MLFAACDSIPVAEMQGVIPWVQEPMRISEYGFFKFEQSQPISFVSKWICSSERWKKVHKKEKSHNMKVYRPKCTKAGTMKIHYSESRSRKAGDKIMQAEWSIKCKVQVGRTISELSSWQRGSGCRTISWLLNTMTNEVHLTIIFLCWKCWFGGAVYIIKEVWIKFIARLNKGQKLTCTMFHIFFLFYSNKVIMQQTSKKKTISYTHSYYEEYCVIFFNFSSIFKGQCCFHWNYSYCWPLTHRANRW